LAKPKRTGEKEGGLGEGIFARPLCRTERGLGWEAVRPCSSKEAKPTKIDSLIEKDFCARRLKDLSIFAGFVRRQATSRRVGWCATGAPLLKIMIFR
jgi:hypothetical protein